MLGHQDEIATSYRESCTELKEKLKIGLDKIYTTYNDGIKDDFSSRHEEYVEDALYSLLVFEKKLIQYVQIKQEMQAENKTMQMKIRELQLYLKAKDLCLVKLKNDIVSHYVQIEFLRKHNEKLENDLEDTRRKLSHFEESQEWLKQHSVQVELKCDENLYINNYNCDKNGETDDQLLGEGNDHLKNYSEWRKFHMQLVRICQENRFLKKALQKPKNNNSEKGQLKRITTTKNMDNNKDMQIPLNNFDIEQQYAKEQIGHFNDIIDCMKVTIIQLQLEKRNMELSIFRMSDYFMRIKNVLFKQKLLFGIENRQCPLKDSVRNESLNNNTEAISEARRFPELLATIKNLKLEKLEMEMEHHEYLSSFSRGLGKMQNILNDINVVYNNISDDNEDKDDIGKCTSIDQIDNNLYQEFSQKENSKYKIQSAISNAKLSSDVNVSEGFTQTDGVAKSRKLSQYILHRMKSMEEQYERIVSICWKNMELLHELDDRSLIPQVRNIKILALVKDKQALDQRNRFERYKRLLLKSTNTYRLSCKEKEKQNYNLKSLYVSVIVELELLKNFIFENQKYLQNSTSIYRESRRKEVLIEVSRKIDNLTKKIQNNINSKLVHSKTSKSNGDRIENQMELRSRDNLNQNIEYINLLKDEINQCYSLIAELKEEKAHLEIDLKQRDQLLGKIFNCFKKKIEDVAVETNDKYFLRRLCNDLRSVIKIYGGQNKVMKEALENNNICTKTIYTQMSLRRNSRSLHKWENIQELLRKQGDSYEIHETFSDIQSHLESMKKDVSLLQNVINKR